MFAYGTNDLSDNKQHNRCNYGGTKGCSCLCEKTASDLGTCETADNLGYRLYTYSDFAKGNLQKEQYFIQIFINLNEYRWNFNKLLLIYGLLIKLRQCVQEISWNRIQAKLKAVSNGLLPEQNVLASA